MSANTRPARQAGSRALVCIAGIIGLHVQLVAAQTPEFVPAYIEDHDLLIFPPAGPASRTTLPPGIPSRFRVTAFSPDGRAIYAQSSEQNKPPSPTKWGSLLKIEVHPARVTEVPGTGSLGFVRCLSVPDPSRLILRVSPNLMEAPRTLEISTDTGAKRQLPTDEPSVCMDLGASVPPRGFLSPDGKRTVTNTGTDAHIVTLQSASAQTIRQSSASTYWTWSPDGRWVAGIVNGDIILVDSNDTPRAKDLGTSGDGSIMWSPDSTRLLIVREESSCAPTIIGRSLQTLDVRTGRREPVRDSRCRVGNGEIGWIDRGVAQ
jgi:hypothetical protein